MADGTGPQKFFLNSLDPGVGKTSCLVAFIRALLASPEHAHVGVVLFSNRLDDIYYQADGTGEDDHLEKAGLVHECLATIWRARRSAATSPCSPRTIIETALVTTMQTRHASCSPQGHLQSRLKSSGSFAKIASLYFRRRPRQVRAWDETILPGFPITVDLLEAYGPRRRSAAVWRPARAWSTSSSRTSTG